MRLEYRYGQVYYADLHPGDMIPNGTGDYTIVTEKDIDENGCLKSNTKISNTLNIESEGK